MGAVWSLAPQDFLAMAWLPDPHYALSLPYLAAAFVTGMLSGLLLQYRRGTLCRDCGEVHRAGACARTDAGAAAAMAAGAAREQRCTICLEAVGAAGDGPGPASGSGCVVLRCGHAFHYDCVAGWCRDRRTCPLCRGRLVRPR